MNKLGKKGCDFFMQCFAKTAGAAALSFGAGVILCLVLPTGALVCIEAALIVGAGAVMFIK